MKDYQIAGPEWLATDRFDMSAKLPDGAKQDQVRDMIKSALAERFHLKVHTESKEFPVYGLIVIKGGIQSRNRRPMAPGRGRHCAQTRDQVAASGGPEGVTVSIGKGSFFTFGDNGCRQRNSPWRSSRTFWRGSWIGPWWI